MKQLHFLGDSRKKLCAFTKDARQDAGYQLDKVQRGEQPSDFKPIPSIGKGVEEIRIWDESGTYRVIYTARMRIPLESISNSVLNRSVIPFEIDR